MRDTTEYININLSTNTATSVTFSNFNTISLTSNIYSINTGTTERIRVDSTNITINTSTLSIINNGNTFATTNIVSDKGNYTFDRINNFTIKKVGTTNNELFKLSETILNISNLTNVDINVSNINISGTSTNISSTNLFVTSNVNIKSGSVIINNDTL
jgi:predicted carbohydrate-binding protein with CBM5 and CBM33 domain